MSFSKTLMKFPKCTPINKFFGFLEITLEKKPFLVITQKIFYFKNIKSIFSLPILSFHCISAKILILIKRDFEYIVLST